MKNRLLSFILILTLIVYGIKGYHFLTGWHPIVMMLIAMFFGLVLNIMIYWVFTFIGKHSKKIPLAAVTATLSGISVIVALKLFGFRWPDIFYYSSMSLGLLFCTSFYWFLSKKSLLSGIFMGSSLIGILYLIFMLINPGSDPYDRLTPSAFSEKSSIPIDGDLLDSPGEDGVFEVIEFTYGSGTDVNREEYAQNIKYKTEAVDATKLIPEWKGKKKKWREQYWEFGADNFPLNARVYMPQGDGPFPITLIVHGNHSMVDYSDDGYGYLGNLLASRGIIAVSVDENFINGHWSGDFRGKEMPARAWLLLKHLEVWRNWNAETGHELSQKVDMDNIMLVGHSRGGEAVSIAAAYNELPYFPDNANEAFDFDFNIKGVVALAPTDYRYERQINLANINFLSLQGSYDADEVSFWGMRPYRRLQFTDSTAHFKAGVYIHHANHGQFNSTWGNSDFGAPAKWLLNLAPLLKEEEQQTAAKVFISAFAEATLKNNPEYISIFKNVALAKEWLPKEHYLTNFEASSTSIIANFEEDLDITKAGDSTFLSAKNMQIWKEENLKTRDNQSQENNAVILGWDVGDKTDSIPTYEIHISSILQNLFTEKATLQLSIAAGNHKWLKPKDKKEEGNEKSEAPQLDFKIELTDDTGLKTALKVSSIKAIPKPLKTRFIKFEFLEADMIGADWEVQLQTYHFPVSQFLAQNLNFNLEQITKIEFIFDQNSFGVVVLDDIAVAY